MKKILTAFTVAVFAILAFSFEAKPAWADTTSPCQGQHCGFDGIWGLSNGNDERQIAQEAKLDATINMDTILGAPANSQYSLGPNRFDCSTGINLEVPISSTGEITGHFSFWYDSPPINFLPAGAWRGSTKDLVYYYIKVNSSEDVVDGVTDTEDELKGAWSDSWRSDRSGVSCNTIGPNAGTCSIPAGLSGIINLDLTRVVSGINFPSARNLAPLIGNGIFYYESQPASEYPMTSSVTVQCAGDSAFLNVERVSYTPLSPVDGQSVGFNGTIKNVGNMTSEPFTPVLYIDVNSDGGGTNWDRTVPYSAPLPGLAGGAQTDVAWSNVWTAVTGTHIYKICPNSTGEGCKTGNMLVADAPLACSTSPNPGAVNQPVSFTASGGDSSWNIFKFMEGTTIAQQSTSNIFSKVFPTAGTKNLAVQKCDGLQCQNLLQNPGFENDLAGYTTTYTNGIAVYTNPKMWWNGFRDFTGDGKMLLIDSRSTQKDFICQEVPVEPNKTYALSLQSRNIDVVNPAPVHKWYVNGTAITGDITAPVDTWLTTNATWNSGNATIAKVCGKNISTSPGGADFAIDNLSFHPELASCVAQPNCGSDTAACSAEVANAAPKIEVTFGNDEVVDINNAANFGTYNVGTGGTTRTLTVKNIGTADLVIYGGGYTWMGGPNSGLAGEFTIPATSDIVVAPGAQTSLNVTFSPTSNPDNTGDKNDYLWISNNDATGPDDTNYSNPNDPNDVRYVHKVKLVATTIASPTVDLKFNGKDTGASVVRGGSGDLSWGINNVSATDLANCRATNWTYDGSTEDGNQSVGPINATTTYYLTCGTANDSVTVNVQDSVSGTDVRDL